MLQSVPDPFDSYGPPQSEDQIFSILAPLSISMTPNPASSSTSPRAGTTPERDFMDSFQTSLANNKITSWLPGTNGAIPVPESPDWANVSPLTATPPRSASPPRSTSPPPRKSSPPNGSPRRHSLPPSGSVRKAETKLRSVLAVIEEDKVRVQSSNRHPASTATLPSSLANSTAPPDPNPQPNWNVNVIHHDLTNVEGDDETPRNSMLFPSSPPPPLDTNISHPDFAVYDEQHGHTNGDLVDPIPQQT